MNVNFSGRGAKTVVHNPISYKSLLVIFYAGVTVVAAIVTVSIAIVVMAGDRRGRL